MYCTASLNLGHSSLTVAFRLRRRVEARIQLVCALTLDEGQVAFYLTALYEILLRPMMSALGKRRLVVVPHRALHYVPFHALFDGERAVIEHREVCMAPSAAVLLHCLRRAPTDHIRGVLIGVPDTRAPMVRDEVVLKLCHTK